MANNPVEIDFIAEAKQFFAESQKVVDSMKKVEAETRSMNAETAKSAKAATMSWTDFRSMYQTVLDVVRVGQQVWDETGQKFANYAVEAGNAARTLGTTTEEASRLIQVADDVGISFDALKTSMKLAQKDGFQPNIEGLARMADEYNQLAPGVERTQYLLDRFGKSGDEMGKLLAKGSESIREMSAAIDENLIVTEEGYKTAEEYRRTVDELKDSFDGLTMKIGKDAIPVVLEFVKITQQSSEAAEDNVKTWEYIVPAIGSAHRAYYTAKTMIEGTTDATIEGTQAAEDAAGAFEDEAERTKRLADEAKVAEQAIKDMTKANQSELAALEKLTSTIDSYKDKQNDLKAQHDELTAKKDKLIKDGWWAESEAVQEVNRDIEENTRKQQENADEFRMATNRRILSRAKELVSIDGLTTEEKNGLIERGLAMGVYTQEAAARMREEEQAAYDLAAALGAIPRNVSTTVTTNYVSTQSEISSYSTGAAKKKATSRDSGGPGAAGEMYMIGRGAQPEAFIPNQNGSFVPNADKNLINEDRLAKKIGKYVSIAIQGSGR